MLNYFSLIFLTGLLTYSSSVLSFINIESLRQGHSKGFAGSTGLAVDGEMGNSQQMSGSLSTLAGFFRTHSETLIVGSYSYGESHGKRDTNNGSLHLRHTLLLVRPFDIEIYTQAEFDEFQQLELRSLYGLGARFTFFQSETSGFHLGAGAFYEEQKLEKTADKYGVRANFYLSYLLKQLKRHEFSAILYYQPYLDRPNDFWLRPTIAFDYFLTERLSFMVNLEYSYNNRPPPEVKSGDLVYQTGLKFSY